MNVWQRHCVFLSFAPVGPIGRGHIQKDLPQFIPRFFVSKLMHGSLCPSHLGAAGFVKSFVHDSLLLIGSCTTSPSLRAHLPSVDGDASTELEPSVWLLLGVLWGDVPTEDVAAPRREPESVVGLLSTRSTAGRSEIVELFSRVVGVAFNPGTVPTVSKVDIGLVLKKPFKFCCPLVTAGGGFAAHPDIARFSGLLVDASPRDRFRPVDGDELEYTVAFSEVWDIAVLGAAMGSP